jgi:hypothetical protein
MGNWSRSKKEGIDYMGFTLKQRREKIQLERDVIKSLQFDLKRIRAAIKQSRGFIKEHQIVLADERKFKRAQKQAARMHARIERIAKMEARLAALKAAA